MLAQGENTEQLREMKIKVPTVMIGLMYEMQVVEFPFKVDDKILAAGTPLTVATLTPDSSVGFSLSSLPSSQPSSSLSLSREMRTSYRWEDADDQNRGHHHPHHLYHHDVDDPVQGLALQLSAGSQLGLHTVAALATLVAGCQVLHISASSLSG